MRGPALPYCRAEIGPGVRLVFKIYNLLLNCVQILYNKYYGRSAFVINLRLSFFFDLAVYTLQYCPGNTVDN